MLQPEKRKYHGVILMGTASKPDVFKAVRTPNPAVYVIIVIPDKVISEGGDIYDTAQDNYY
jgi:hypothetical protein